MFRHRQQLRLWAARVLLVWVFAMGAGVANACLPKAATEHAGLPTAQGSEASASHHGEADAPHGATDAANCADICDKASVSIPMQKPTSDDMQAHPLICVVAATALPAPVLEPTNSNVPRRDGVQAPPIPISIAFLRLAL